MSALTGALRAADVVVVVGWFTADQLARTRRTAYDPDIGVALERHPTIGRDLGTAGPVAVAESWDRLRSDSAFHAVL